MPSMGAVTLVRASLSRLSLICCSTWKRSDWTWARSRSTSSRRRIFVLMISSFASPIASSLRATCANQLALAAEKTGLGALQFQHPRLALVALLVELADGPELLGDQRPLPADASELPLAPRYLLAKLRDLLIEHLDPGLVVGATGFELVDLLADDRRNLRIIDIRERRVIEDDGFGADALGLQSRLRRCQRPQTVGQRSDFGPGADVLQDQKRLAGADRIAVLDQDVADDPAFEVLDDPMAAFRRHRSIGDNGA